MLPVLRPLTTPHICQSYPGIVIDNASTREVTRSPATASAEPVPTMPPEDDDAPGIFFFSVRNRGVPLFERRRVEARFGILGSCGC